MNGAFASEAIAKLSQDFICVKASQKLANTFKVKVAPAVVIVDPDGAEILRAPLLDESSISTAWESALKKYSSQPISWGTEVAAGSASKKLLVIGFDVEKSEALGVLEDRMLVKLHERCEFVKLAYEKDSETAKRWNVMQSPTIILCDPRKENPEKNPLDKISGKKSPAALKLALIKALKKIDDAK